MWSARYSRGSRGRSPSSGLLTVRQLFAISSGDHDDGLNDRPCATAPHHSEPGAMPALEFLMLHPAAPGFASTGRVLDGFSSSVLIELRMSLYHNAVCEEHNATSVISIPGALGPSLSDRVILVRPDIQRWAKQSVHVVARHAVCDLDKTVVSVACGILSIFSGHRSPDQSLKSING